MKPSRASRLPRIALVLFAAVVTSAHFGSRDIIYEGPAGPYHIAVLIQPPLVIPAQATIVVEVHGDAPATVTVQPVRWDLARENAPLPEPLLQDSGLSRFRGQVWLMTLGSYRLRVTVHGPRGEGTASIPVPALLGRRPTSGIASSLLLSALGIGLAVGTIIVVMSIARDGTRQPGRPANRADNARAARAGRVSALACIGVSAIIGIWWFQLSAGYDRRVFRPYGWNVSLVPQDQSGELRIRLADPRWDRAAARPIADHGHLIHLFLIRAPSLDVMAHLHPVAVDSFNLKTTLPPLPPGTYRLFGDLVHADGVAETLIDSLVVSASPDTTWRPSSLDDSWWSESTAQRDVAFGWTGPSVAAGNLDNLAFAITDSDGAPVPHQPFMGMDGHAMVIREDLSVFAHLHPMGSVSLAAMDRMIGPGEPSVTHPMQAAPGTLIRFPWVFPRGGHYRVWGQTRVGGTIVTGMADISVEGAQ
ncbi:MAG: hypothetical protein ABI679_03990 [Gemmatimonadota bacterium]